MCVDSLISTSIPLRCYSEWLPLLTTQDDIEATFKEMKGAGVKVLRTWVNTCLSVVSNT